MFGVSTPPAVRKSAEVDWSTFKAETGLSLAQLAQLFGVSPRSISNWLSGAKTARQEHLLKIERYIAGELVIVAGEKCEFMEPEAAVWDPDVEVIGTMAAFQPDPVEHLLALLTELAPEQLNQVRDRIVHGETPLVLAEDLRHETPVPENSHQDLARALAVIHTRAMSNPQVNLSSEEETVQLNVRVPRSLRERAKAEAARRGVSEAVYVRSLLSVAVPVRAGEL